jgi:hypothetical protein
MKARDVIPGWPRGRSSSRPIRIPTWFRYAWLRSRLGESAFGPSDVAFEEFTRAAVKVFFEAEEDQKYRAEQDRKVAEYRAERFQIREFLRNGGGAEITRAQYDEMFPRRINLSAEAQQ